MTANIKYRVFLARLRFVEANNYKTRPVIVVSKPQGRYGIVIVMPISSKTDVEPVDIRLSNYQQAGLLKPSVARIHRLTAIPQTDLLEELGGLGSSQVIDIQQAINKLFEI